MGFTVLMYTRDERSEEGARVRADGGDEASHVLHARQETRAEQLCGAAAAGACHAITTWAILSLQN